MASCIIDALRHIPQLKGSLFHAAKELAHRADAYSGSAYMSYSYLASKCHQSPRTAFRHIQRLLDLGIIARQRFWYPDKHKYGVNKYTFLIAWEKPRAHLGISATLDKKFPPEEHPSRNTAKFGTVAGWQRGKEKVLTWLTEGSIAWQAVQDAQIVSGG